MGREGFEPSTLGLRVRSDRPRRAATSCSELHRALQQAATNYGRCGNAETSLYAQPYAQGAVIPGTVGPANYLADYGIAQVILTGTGTLDGFGPATEVGGVTADRSFQPCGVNSETAALARCIVTADGTIAIRESNETCATPTGRVATGTFEMDGLSSTGSSPAQRGVARF